MWYLITQYWFWLMLAFVLGLIIGWMTWGGKNKGWGWLPLGALVASVAFLLSWFRIVNGLHALWLETGVMLFISYIGGCWLGGVLKAAFAPEIVTPAADVMAAPKPAPVAAIVPAPVAVAAPVPAPAPVPAVAASSPKVVAESAPAPQIADEANYAGKRPPGLAAPRGGKADDLKWIRGIGKQNEGRLHGLGIWHFDQVAAWTKEQVEWVGSYLAFPGRIDREEWIMQARELTDGEETEFAKRARRGQVPTSKDDGGFGQGNVEKLGAGARPANVGRIITKAKPVRGPAPGPDSMPSPKPKK